MGILFMVLFTLAEVTLVILTFTIFSEKATWLRNRTIVRAVETALLPGIILLPTTTMKRRFLFALGIMVIRLIAAGIQWLVHHERAAGTRKKVSAVICCAESIFFMTVSVAPALPFVNIDDIPSTVEFRTEEIDGIIADKLADKFFAQADAPDNLNIHFFE